MTEPRFDEPRTSAMVIADASHYAEATVMIPPGRAWRVITALLFVTLANGALSIGAIITSQSAAHTVAVTKAKADGGRAAVCTALALNSAHQAVQIDLPPACADENVAPLLPPTVCAAFHTRPPDCARDWPHDLRG